MKGKKFDDFKELLSSIDKEIVIMALIMLKSSIPFKSMTEEELDEFWYNFRHVKYNYKGWDSRIYEIEGKIKTKINNCKQRIYKNERRARKE